MNGGTETALVIGAIFNLFRTEAAGSIHKPTSALSLQRAL